MRRHAALSTIRIMGKPRERALSCEACGTDINVPKEAAPFMRREHAASAAHKRAMKAWRNGC